MGKIKMPELVTPIASVFTSDEKLFEPVKEILSKRLGSCIYESSVLPFNHTDYYTAEMGSDLKRCIFAFDELIDPSELPALKLWSNSLEQDRAVDGKRQVNIDVGYISLGKLVLASTKDHSHRIYLGKGIYGEVTLRLSEVNFSRGPGPIPIMQVKSIAKSLAGFASCTRKNFAPSNRIHCGFFVLQCCFYRQYGTK